MLSPDDNQAKLRPVAIGCYLRVSTDKQSTANQWPEVERLIAAREGADPPTDLLIVYNETVSASSKVRPEFSRMLEDARTGKLRRLYIWSIDRFGRSMYQNLRDLGLLLDQYHVEIFSVREPWIEKGAAEPLTRDLLIGVFSWVAQHEHARLRDRTVAGLARARASGKILGRREVVIPARSVERAAAIRAASQGRLGWRPIARMLKREGLGEWAHSTLAAACLKTVPHLERGKRGNSAFRGSGFGLSANRRLSP